MRKKMGSNSNSTNFVRSASEYTEKNQDHHSHQAEKTQQYDDLR